MIADRLPASMRAPLCRLFALVVVAAAAVSCSDSVTAPTNYAPFSQTDLRVGREQCGGPVVDLDGKPVGIAIARADRTRSFVIPGREIAQLLERDPVTPEVALAAGVRQRVLPAERGMGSSGGGGQAPRVIPAPRGAAENLRRHLEEMERLMERMRTEMEGIE